MRTSYIKKNSHTQLQANNAVIVMQSAIAASNMSRDEWVALMFEIGCLLAENKYKGNAIYYLNGEIPGYWDWFYALWLDDDKVLIDHYGTNIPNYHSLKMELIR